MLINKNLKKSKLIIIIPARLESKRLRRRRSRNRSPMIFPPRNQRLKLSPKKITRVMRIALWMWNPIKKMKKLWKRNTSPKKIRTPKLNIFL